MVRRPHGQEQSEREEKLPVIRELIRAGKIHEAERLCKQALSGTPSGMRIYQTLGDISVDYDLGGELSEGASAGMREG